MDDKKDEKLIVDVFEGGKTGIDLLGCYFKLNSNGTLNFHDKNDEKKGSDEPVGTKFTVKLHGIPHLTWTIEVTKISGNKLKGDWTNDAPNPGGEEGGTFQAQAGGNVPAENSAASANAY